MTLTINSFFGWDFNSCETLRQNGVFHPIDFANACPDSQVTSLHYFFPWLVKAMVKWAVFCAVTQRPMRRNLDWQPYFEIAAREMPLRERLSAYTRRSLERDSTVTGSPSSATAICRTWTSWSGSSSAPTAPRRRCAPRSGSSFPPHELEEFTEHFWGLIQFWRKTETDRMQAD